MAKVGNVWDRRRDLLAERMRQGADQRAESLRGGKLPPGKVMVPSRAALEEYLLLAQSVEQLTPEQAQQADAIWQQKYAGRDRADIVDWVVAMEKLRTRYAQPTDSPASTDVEEQGEPLQQDESQEPGE